MTRSKTEIQAVVFDMDGILIDSEPLWWQVREEFATQNGLRWRFEDQQAAMGFSTRAWSRFMVERLQLKERLGMDEAAIVREIKGRLLRKFEEHLPERAGALDAVRRSAEKYKVALATGSANDIAEFVMRATGLDQVFVAMTCGDDVDNGKPAPDIYLDVLAKIGVAPEHAVGVEDSGNGIRSLRAAGMGIIAAPGAEFPLAPDVLALADVRIDAMTELSHEAIERAALAHSARRRAAS